MYHIVRAGSSENCSYCVLYHCDKN